MFKKSVLCGGIVVVVLLLFCNANVNAQNQPPGVLGKVNIASPNSAALGKYVDVPVNIHTGIPQISVPIYTLEEGPLKLPISISYHAGGVKLNDISSCVGLGWSLQAGGVVTRTVRGTPDEKGVGEFGNNAKGYLSDNGINNYLFNPEMQSPLPSHDVFATNDFNEGRADGEPDLFVFNFNGHSGKFYFNDDGQPVLLPESDYKIEYTYDYANGPGLPKSITKFKITVPDGTKYFFGITDATNDVDPIEKTHNFHIGADGLLYYGTNLTINSWYLNKIVSADDKFSINLNYSSEEYSYKEVMGGASKSGSYQANHPDNWKYYSHWVQGVRLSGILSTGSAVNFEAGNAREDLSDETVYAMFTTDMQSTKAKTLSSIQISSNNGYCKKFKFYYSYFTSSPDQIPAGMLNAATDLKRLRLDQLKEESCDGTTTVPPYKFEYSGEPVPRRLSFAQDHWGFINGKTGNQDLIPTFTEKTNGNYIKEFKGADRDSYWPAMRAGSLNKIIYPTGGSSSFEFEPNTTWLSYPVYNKIFRYGFSMGYDGNNTVVVRNYTFSNNPYRIRLTNTNSGGNSGVFIHCDNFALSAQPGQTVEVIKTFPAGPCNISLSKPDAVSGNGTEVFIEEWVPEQLTTNAIVGGLRIKKVTFDDGTGGPNMVTDYSYNESNGKSSGHLYSRPTYLQFSRNDVLKDEGLFASGLNTSDYCSPYGFDYCPAGSHMYIISSSSTRPMETTQGNHIGYNEVKVSSGTNGYSLYRYYGSNIWDANVEDVAVRSINTNQPQSLNFPNYPVAPAPMDFKRGELKYEETGTQTGQLIKQSYYFYDYQDNPLKTPAIIVKNGAWFIGLPTFYNLYTAKKIKYTVQERIYQQSGVYLETETQNFIESPFHNQVTRRIATSSKGEQIETKYKYAADFKPDNCTSISTGLSTYNTECATCETQYYQNRMAAGHNNAYWKFWDYQTLIKCRSNARINFFTSRKNYFDPAVAGSYANCLNNAKNNANAELKPIYELQSRNILAPIESTTWINGKIAGAGFNKFDYSASSPGFAYPVNSQSIPFQTTSTNFTASAISGNALIKDSRYEVDVTYKLENGVMTEILGKDGIPTSYIWGHNYTLPIVRAVGVSYSTLLNAYNAVSGNLAQLRNHSSLSTAHISTYQYIPGVGIVSETDPRGRKIYYEYDKLNRLVLIRDNENNVLKKICYNYAGQPENCMPTPPPPACDATNCTGNDKKCINGLCETGLRINISSVYFKGKWTCTYKYRWSDGSESPLYSEVGTAPCPLTIE